MDVAGCVLTRIMQYGGTCTNYITMTSLVSHPIDLNATSLLLSLYHLRGGWTRSCDIRAYAILYGDFCIKSAKKFSR